MSKICLGLFLLQAIVFGAWYMLESERASRTSLTRRFVCDRICDNASAMARTGQPNNRERQECYDCFGSRDVATNNVGLIATLATITSLLCVAGYMFGQRD